MKKKWMNSIMRWREVSSVRYLPLILFALRKMRDGAVRAERVIKKEKEVKLKEEPERKKETE